MIKLKKLKKGIMWLSIGMLGYFLSLGPIAAHLRDSTEEQQSRWEFYCTPMAFACDLLPSLEVPLDFYADLCDVFLTRSENRPTQYILIKGNPRGTVKKITSSHPTSESR